MRFVATLMPLLCMLQCSYADFTEKELVASISKTIQYSESNQGAVWPGLHMGATPVIVEFEKFELDVDTGRVTSHEQRHYGINLTPMNLPWQKLEIDAQPVYYLDQVLFDRITERSGKMDMIDGQRGYFISGNSLLGGANDNAFMNGRFNYYFRYESRFPKEPLAALRYDYADFLQAQNVKLTYLEQAALLNSLRNEGAMSEVAMQDAVAIHQYRTKLLSKEAAEFEEVSNVVFGINYFVTIKSLNLSDIEYAKRARQLGCLPLNVKYGIGGILQCVAHSVMGLKDSNSLQVISSLAKGAVLDKKDNSGSWKTTAETEFKSIDTMLQAFYHLSDAKAAEITKQAMANPQYDYASISRTVDYLLPGYIDKVANLSNAYQQQSGIELHGPWHWGYYIGHPLFGPQVGESYQASANLILKANAHGSGFQFGNDRIKFIHLPVGLVRMKYNTDSMDYDGESIFKLLPDSQLVIDGKADTVAHFVNSHNKQSFHQLAINDAHVIITVDGRAGSIDGRDGHLTVTLENQQ